MVSKIAVIALVLVVAVPILMGYGLNIETETHTTYTEDLEKTNVTPLIAQSEEYRYVVADAYSLNTQPDLYQAPIYVKHSSAYSSLYFHQSYARDWNGGAYFATANFQYFYLETWATHVSAYVDEGSGSYPIINDVTAVSYGIDDDKLHVIHGGDESVFIGGGSTVIALVPGTGFVTGDMYEYTMPKTAYDDPAQAAAQGLFVDISAGFYIPSYAFSVSHLFSTPAPSSEQIITLDLSVPAHDLIIQTYSNCIYLDSTGSGWSIYTQPAWNLNEWEHVADLPFSVYQFLLNKQDFTINYVGDWPDDIGLANSYRTWGPFPAKGDNEDTRYIMFRFPTGQPDSNSPIIRIDVAKLRSVTYSVINDATYNPSTIKPVNPSTTINGIYNTGTSISFGGNTYAASAGNITVGTHQISLQGCKFDSVFNGVNYDNRINGNVVSTSAVPSTITFNGTWGIADITSTSMVSADVTDTKWIPGSFAWQGVDTNFKLAGLMASLAIFIALAIYGRRSGSNVLPLLLICGGAAFVFLLMI